MKRTILKILNLETEWDLISVNILSLLLILIIFLFPDSPVRLILGLPFVLFFTGYVSICALFPRKDELDIIERMAFSIGLSVCITALIGLILNYTASGITVYSVLFSLFSFILLVSIVALYRRLSTGAVFTPLASVGSDDAVKIPDHNRWLYKVKSERKIFNRLKLEHIALPLFIAISLFLYRQRYFSYIFVVIAAAIGALLYIVLNRNSAREAVLIAGTEESRTIQTITTSLFFILYGLSFLTLLHGFYTRTVWNYVFISLCAGVIAVEILFVRTVTQSMINLVKSFLLVLNITMSNLILFNYGIALPDFAYHFSLVQSIINSGHVPHVGGYEYFPGHHIFTGANILICGSDPKMTYLYLGALTISLGLLFVFIIGREFVNTRFGLFAALMYTCLDYLLMYGTHPEHQAYNYFLSIVLFAVVLYIYKRGDWRFTAIYPVLVTTMVFTHHYCAMIILIVLSSLIIVEVCKRIKERNYKYRLLGLAQIYAIIMFAQWIYYSNMMGSFVGIIEAYKSVFTKGATSLIPATAYDLLPIRTIFLNTLGSSILMMFAVIGFLCFFNKYHRTFFKDGVMAITAALSVLLGIGVVFKYYALLPDRLYPFLQLFGLVYLASTGVTWLLANFKVDRNGLKAVPVIALIVCLSFFSLSSTIAGFETSPFVDENMAYPKLYGTPQEYYFGQWQESNINDKYLFSMDMGLEEALNEWRRGISGKIRNEFDNYGFTLPVTPKVIKSGKSGWAIIDRTSGKQWYMVRKEDGQLKVYNITKIISRLSITKEGCIDINNITQNSFVVLDKFYLKTGFVKRVGSHLGQHEFIRVKEEEVCKLGWYAKYYDNGMVVLYYKS